jgi:acyl dehydratase
MRALLAGPAGTPVADYASLLLRRRRGLADAAQMPSLERSQPEARFDPLWLAAYRAITGLGGAATAPLPPLALQLAAAPLHLSLLADARFPFRALGIVHLAQAVRQHQPLPASAPYALRAFTAGAREVRRGIAFTLVTEARLSGSVVWRGETVALAPSREPRQTERAPEPQAGPDWAAVARLEAIEALGRRYAAVAQDKNPIHQHALLARPFGFRRAIVHGTWTLAAALGKAGLPASSDYTLRARFQKPVLLPSRVSVQTRAGEAGQEVRVVSLAGDLVHLRAQVSAGGAAPGEAIADPAGLAATSATTV